MSSTYKQTVMISLFLEVALDQTPDTARYFLQATGWNLEEALQLFYVESEFGDASSSPCDPSLDNDDVFMPDQDFGWTEENQGCEFGDAPSTPCIQSLDNDVFTPDQDSEWTEGNHGCEFGDAPWAPCIPSQDNDVFTPDQDSEWAEGNYGSDQMCAPLPILKDVLYSTPTLYERPSTNGVWEADQDSTSAEADQDSTSAARAWEADQDSTSAAKTCEDNLASLYSPPFTLMYNGSFEKAKEAARGHDRWLLVNVQSTKEFSSHTLNRDTWGNDLVAQTISSYFIFWQIHDDTEEGSKISTYYKLDTFPAILVIDPITGLKMRLWHGMIQPEILLENVLQFMETSPKNHIFSSSHKHLRKSSHARETEDETNEDDEETKLAKALSMQTISEVILEDPGTITEVLKGGKYNYPALPEEPKGDKSMLCRVGFRLPDGSRVQRSFLRSDPIQLLWSFCAAKCGDEKPFRLTLAIPGAVRSMDYDSLLTFDDSGVANSMISVTWE